MPLCDTFAWGEAQLAAGEGIAGRKYEVIRRLHQDQCDALVSVLAYARSEAGDYDEIVARLERLTSAHPGGVMVRPTTPTQKPPEGATVADRDLAEDTKFVKDLQANEQWRKAATGSKLLELAAYWMGRHDGLLAKIEDLEAEATVARALVRDLEAEAGDLKFALESSKGRTHAAEKAVRDLEAEAKFDEDQIENLRAKAESQEAAYRQLEAATAGAVEDPGGELAARLQKRVADLEHEAEVLRAAGSKLVTRLKDIEAEAARYAGPELTDEEAQDLGLGVWDTLRTT